MSERNDTSDTSEYFVPLESRLAHLNIDGNDIYPKLMLGDIADELGIDFYKVKRALEICGVEPEFVYSERAQRDVPVHPHYALELVRDERAFREMYLELPKYITTKTASDTVGRSYNWTQRMLTDIYPDARQMRSGHRSRMYPRTAVLKLRDLIFSIPPDGGWPTTPDLITFSGRSKNWVISVLSEASIQPEDRLQILTGNVLLHYPPQSYEVLKVAMETLAAPAGNWVNENTIQYIVQRSDSWVKKRLDESYKDLAELRLDDNGVERLHYPPEVAKLLKTESDMQNAIPDASGWLTESAVGKVIGYHRTSLRKIMQLTELESEERLDKLGRPKEHYSPATIERLAQKAIELFNYPAANGWVTFNEAKDTIGRSAKWIQSQIDEGGFVSELRRTKDGLVTMHYDTVLVESIRQYGDSLDAGELLSIEQIAVLTNKSKPTIASIVKKLEFVAVKRFASNGHFVNHYLPEVVDTIMALYV